MGTICTNVDRERFDRNQQPNQNQKLADILLGKFCHIQIIHGIYRHHHSETLLAIAESSKLDLCDELTDYCTDVRSVTAKVMNERKTLVSVPIKKYAPYKKLLICCLSRYDSTDWESSQQQLRNIIDEIIENNKEISLQMNPTSDNVQRMGNQIILALMFGQIMKKVKEKIRLSLISSQVKTLNLFRFQLMKTQSCEGKLYFPH